MHTCIRLIRSTTDSGNIAIHNVSLCVGGRKGKAGTPVKCIPEKRDTTDGKIMHKVNG